MDNILPYFKKRKHESNLVKKLNLSRSATKISGYIKVYDQSNITQNSLRSPTLARLNSSKTPMGFRNRNIPSRLSVPEFLPLVSPSRIQIGERMRHNTPLITSTSQITPRTTVGLLKS